MTRDERAKLCEARVTLNGRRAYVSGTHRDFARVTERATGLSCEWEWETVALVISRGGKFRS